jgi:hypothetical protein
MIWDGHRSVKADQMAVEGQSKSPLVHTADTDAVLRCPKCGRLVESLSCGHCGSQLETWQADLYGAAVRQLAKMGGNRADAGHQGGGAPSNFEGENGDSQPKDNGGDHPGENRGGADSRSGNGENTETPPLLCRWIYERLDDAGIHPETILDPCAGRGNLTHPFQQAKVVAYEINEGKNFSEAKAITCDLVLCNPPWRQAEWWLPHIVEVVGRDTPTVYICPTMYMIGYMRAQFRQYLESPVAPPLDHFTPLPIDTFPGALGQGAIYWFNLPNLRKVALVPSGYLSRREAEHKRPTTANGAAT